MTSVSGSYDELITLQNAAHALDRIRQAFRDNSVTDPELAHFVGERLSEVYGPTRRADIPAQKAGEAQVTALVFASRGTVTSKGMTRYAERYADGSVTVHTSRTIREATPAEADTYRAD